jgi:hypothetical protein
MCRPMSVTYCGLTGLTTLRWNKLFIRKVANVDDLLTATRFKTPQAYFIFIYSSLINHIDDHLLLYISFLIQLSAQTMMLTK